MSETDLFYSESYGAWLDGFVDMPDPLTNNTIYPINSGDGCDTNVALPTYYSWEVPRSSTSTHANTLDLNNTYYPLANEFDMGSEQASNDKDLWKMPKLYYPPGDLRAITELPSLFETECASYIPEQATSTNVTDENPELPYSLGDSWVNSASPYASLSETDHAGYIPEQVSYNHGSCEIPKLSYSPGNSQGSSALMGANAFEPAAELGGYIPEQATGNEIQELYYSSGDSRIGLLTECAGYMPAQGTYNEVPELSYSVGDSQVGSVSQYTSLSWTGYAGYIPEQGAYNEVPKLSYSPGNSQGCSALMGASTFENVRAGYMPAQGAYNEVLGLSYSAGDSGEVGSVPPYTSLSGTDYAGYSPEQGTYNEVTELSHSPDDSQMSSALPRASIPETIIPLETRIFCPICKPTRYYGSVHSLTRHFRTSLKHGPASYFCPNTGNGCECKKEGYSRGDTLKRHFKMLANKDINHACLIAAREIGCEDGILKSIELLHIDSDSV
ncbi:hypothetical protein EW145_g5887 [Phellinidium pouzarii]|uniref:Uncharacterized protein n=1 Tax=Phellinidium pouzarii TaxID=167371 RepID=A0A4S4KYF8_9AGAM|nr:hypothetical protein EW145_g5887 [Phellinidium pouzarii]